MVGEEKVPDTFSGNCRIFQERGFNSSASKGEWDEHHEAVRAALLAPSEAPRADARDPRGITRRAVGSPAVFARSSLPAWSAKKWHHALVE